MKTHIHNLFLGLVLLAGLTQTARAAVAFTITPAAVSNTYGGTITLQVTGLTNTETVVVQKFLDANTNGVIDAADILWQQFQLKDGKASVIGGVTNINVPGDTDVTSGQITARLNLPSYDFSQNMSGKYAIKLSSPGGRFSPLTNLFTITNVPYSQAITGSVVNSGTNVPNAVIVIFPERPGHGPGNPLGGAVADNSGNYAIPAPAGTYILLPFKSNCVAGFSTVILTNGDPTTANLTITDATQSISGKVADAATNSIGLPGLFLHGFANGLFSTAFSDTNGNFTMRVSPGQWEIGLEGLAAHGNLESYSENFTIDTTSGSSNGVIIPYPKATALFYGSVKDDQNHPLAGAAIFSHDNLNQYYQNVLTDTNGNYVAGTLGGQAWSVEVENSQNSALANYLFSQGLYNTNLSAGQAVLQNFAAILATNRLTGNVKAYGTNIIGVNVDASATINTVMYQVYGSTDANGNYSLNVANGSWSVSLNCTGPDNGLDGILGSGNYLCPSNQTVAINNTNGMVNFTVGPSLPPQVLLITTTSLSDGTASAFYNQSLAASGGWLPYTWSLSPGSASLPPGLTLQANGTLSGTPASLGSFYFFVRVTDAAMATDDQLLSLTVKVASSLQVTNDILPEGVRGTSYSQQLVASGGQLPYLWSLSPGSDDLPPGLTLSTNGILSGNPTSGGNFFFFVRVTDGITAVADQLIFVDVLDVDTISLPNGVQGTSYRQQVAASGGQLPYVWSLSPGSASLPPGLTLSANGILSGVPSSVGVYTFSVSVTDGASLTASRSLSFVTMRSLQTLLQVPTLSSPTFPPSGGCQFTVSGVGGQYYTLEYSTNLINWIPLFGTNFTGSSFTYNDFAATDKCRFYRAQASGAIFTFMQAIVYTSPTNGSAMIPVLRAGGLSSGLYVNYATTTGGTATAGVDYTPVSGTLYFPPTVASNNIVVPIIANSNTNQDLTVVVRISSLDGRIPQFAVLDIQRPQSTPGAVMVVNPGNLTFALPNNCAQTVTVSNAGPQGSVLNFLATDDGGLGGFLGYQLTSDGIMGRYVIGTLPAGTSAEFQVSVLPDWVPYFVAEDDFWHWSWPMLTTFINFYQLSANHQSSEIPAAVIYPAEITTVRQITAKYIGNWSGTWSGTSSPMGTTNPPTTVISGGNWTLSIQKFSPSTGSLAGQVSGTFSWHGTDAYWSESPFFSFSLPVNLGVTFANWTYNVFCDGKTVRIFPHYPMGENAISYDLQINEFLFGGSGPRNWASTVWYGWPSVSNGTYIWSNASHE